jgi:hypothetical protein
MVIRTKSRSSSEKRCSLPGLEQRQRLLKARLPFEDLRQQGFLIG